MPGCTGSGSTTSAQSSGYVAGIVRWSTCRYRNRAQTRRGASRAEAGPGRTAQRRPSDALPRASRIRRAARHRDVLPHPLERCHDIPAGRALDDAEQGYVVEAICRWIVGQYAPTTRSRDRIPCGQGDSSR